MEHGDRLSPRSIRINSNITDDEECLSRRSLRHQHDEREPSELSAVKPCVKLDVKVPTQEHGPIRDSARDGVIDFSANDVSGSNNERKALMNDENDNIFAINTMAMNVRCSRFATLDVLKGSFSEVASVLLAMTTFLFSPILA